MSELKPCLLCEGSVELWPAKETKFIGRVIECKKCGFRFCDPTAILDDQIITRWNRRANDAAD